MRSDITPGGTFPDYELPDHTETPRSSASCRATDPMILTLARRPLLPEGAPAAPRARGVPTEDRRRLHADRHDRDHEASRAAGVPRLSVGAQWTFLSDPGRTIQQDLDIQEYTDPDHNPMIPHTLVLKPGLVVHSIYNGYWFWGRPSVHDLWRDLRTATSEIRPDWDLAAPGLREAWDRRSGDQVGPSTVGTGEKANAGRALMQQPRPSTRAPRDVIPSASPRLG